MEAVQRIRFGRKGLSGKVLSTLISLIIAIAALAVLWIFLLKSSPLIKTAVESMISGFKEGICGKGVLSWPIIKNVCKAVVK